MDRYSNGETNYDENFTLARELVMNLVEIGADPNTCKTVMCLHVHGPSTSTELQTRCGLRQPDVSVAINLLKSLKSIEVTTLSKGTRGRPSQSYSLTVSLQDALEPFKEEAFSNINKINSRLSIISELTKKVSLMAE
jgi:predicted transcriptional regulator